ncbi:UDP-N-acetylmuramoyl-tripeptide--D-alanyl-D-alanine ligase [Meiothermus hypogaeus]|uniref:UDP-N-acetylmuramoylalanyl-D-glutamyl-2, 6-diaminopimelate--D-alanyl-D-alanine ligase n=2 Tax=Meiothermus hypogaeus TaxID=884155 RepID=A0A511QX33_9DEIN|nr:Mur ligase family protein [Meiothermus hypogaeus]RIH78946.1 UDP-N-acetylmuramoyl-tripeptide--D-alanyl-D-alanine ligase [Meiothermus hypogaeus]GEM81938.1 UDP-N-acetylmuramoylalanyl-D-glutamyl-2, 6-diaminopimelate--D-alanyl-D-alanine ligase [Meiothermus hypogaeus NBRC 106114]
MVQKKGPRELQPEWVASLTGGKAHEGAAVAHDLHWDSRKVAPGVAFFALPGAKTHGREFGLQALEAGAAFVVTDLAHPGAVQVEKPERALLAIGRALRDRFGGTVLAVGGSSGKTTTKECLAQGLGWPAPEGNLNNAPGLARFFLHLEEGEGAVVELGIDRLLEMAELTYLARPDFAVLTSLGEEHLEGLGNLENVIREESWLLQVSALRLSSIQAAEVVRLPNLKTYGIGAGDFRAENLELGLNASRFHFEGHPVGLPYPGVGPVMGALAALAATRMLDKPLADTIERLAALRLPPGRMQRLQLGGVDFIHDAYNSNPLSFRAGMQFLQTQPGRKWLVLGRMAELGEEALKHHLEAARLAAAISPNLIFVGPFAQQQAAEAGGSAVETVEEAAELLARSAVPGDLVYLKASRSVGLERLLELWPREEA